MTKNDIRIGILTFSRSINYGAFLQCYSLFSKIKKLFNNVSVINYSLVPAEIGFFIQSFLRSPIKGLIQYYIFRKCAINEFNFTKKKVISNFNKSIDFINSLNFDLVIAGSDEIWKINRFRKYPNVYWASKAIKAKKISYAASANRTFINRISKKNILDMQNELGNYKYLGVRDNQTYDFLNSLEMGKKIHINCDPTFLYDFRETPTLTRRLTEKYKLDYKKPIIGLITDDKKVGLSAKSFFGKEYQIVSITSNNLYADTWLYDLNPFEWANVFKLFSGCITSYFHGMIFSILSDVPFVAFDYESYSLANETKIFNLIKKSKLDMCYVNILKESFENISKKLETNIIDKTILKDKFHRFVKSEKAGWIQFEKQLKRLVFE